jgi:hypothetical protein
MKQLIKFTAVFFTLFMFIQCTSSDTDNAMEASIIGRWKIVGFDNVQYEFTANKRYAIYTNGNNVFPTLQEFIDQNPGIAGLDWYYEGTSVVVDLNFGNLSKLTPTFKCANNVIDWKSEDSTLHATYYKVNHDISSCN